MYLIVIFFGYYGSEITKIAILYKNKKQKTKHSPQVEYKDDKSQKKYNDNCDYFTVDFTIFNIGSFDTSCNKKEIYKIYFFSYEWASHLHATQT